MEVKYVKLIVYTPETHGDTVREALGDAGAGRVGNYSHNSFSVRGTGRFMSLLGAKPTIGEVGRLEKVAEERIETICEVERVEAVVEAARAVHPYEHMAYDVYSLLNK